MIINVKTICLVDSRGYRPLSRHLKTSTVTKKTDMRRVYSYCLHYTIDISFNYKKMYRGEIPNPREYLPLVQPVHLMLLHVSNHLNRHISGHDRHVGQSLVEYRVPGLVLMRWCQVRVHFHATLMSNNFMRIPKRRLDHLMDLLTARNLCHLPRINLLGIKGNKGCK